MYNWRTGAHTINVENWIDNISVKLKNPSLAVSNHEIQASVGGSSSLTIDAGVANAGKGYVIFTGITGVSPGTWINGLHAPLNLDVWTWTAFSLINTPVMANFMGTLDGNGRATGTFLFPMPEPAAQGLPMYFNAWVLKNPGKTPVVFVSNWAYILFTP